MMDGANDRLTHLPAVDSLICDTGIDEDAAVMLFIEMGVTHWMIDWCNRVHGQIQEHRFQQDDPDVSLRWKVHEASLPGTIWKLCASLGDPYQMLYFLDILGRPAAYAALVQHVLQSSSAKSFSQSKTASSTTMS